MTRPVGFCRNSLVLAALAYGAALLGSVPTFLAAWAVWTCMLGHRLLGALPLSVKAVARLRFAAVAGVGILVLRDWTGSLSPSPAAVDGKVDAAAFAALPYLDFAPAGLASGTAGGTHHDPAAAAPGLNLYCPTGAPEARLLSMDGRLLHRWSPSTGFRDWKYVDLAPDGGLLVLATDEGLMKLRPDGSLAWAAELPAHHSFFQADDGGIHVLTRRQEFLFWNGLPVPILDDRMVELAPSGAVRSEMDLRPLFRSLLAVDQVAQIYGRELLLPWKTISALLRGLSGDSCLVASSAFDTWHSNSIQRVSEAVEGVAEPGDWLMQSEPPRGVGPHG